ncbi:MAG: hypothetical protein K6F00_02075 [Lachnospiraceae bacterium]|nr:hypothetical protein [Lachnospiraceae bacterium]
MGELILCKGHIAANPYYIEMLSLNIYSLEELCYYVKNNSDLLDYDFESKELAGWIGRELHMNDLENELLSLIDEEVPLHIFAEHILTSCGYLTVNEIRDVVAVIENYENIGASERKKIRADKLLGSERIIDAIFAYEDLLLEDGLSSNLRGDICHNLGCAYARLFFFDEAGEYFEKAYKKNQRRASLIALLNCSLCKKDDSLFTGLCEKYHIPGPQREAIRDAVRKAYQSDEIKDFENEISRLKNDHNHHEAFKKLADEIINKWKDEYNHLCRI